MKNRKMLCKIIVILIIIISVVGINSYRNYKEEQLKSARIEKREKMWIMIIFGLDDYDEDSEEDLYEEEFLRDENLPTLLVYFKKYMNDNHPDIGYGSKYEEITMERLKAEYSIVLEELNAMSMQLEGQLSTQGRIYNVMGRVDYEMRKNGIWIGDGADKVAEDSPEALSRKAKAGCMDFLYIDGYDTDYVFSGYKDSIFVEFLRDKRLQPFLDYLKEYMESNHSEIGYGSKYEEVTIERLETEYEDVYEELLEMSTELEEGIAWNEIVRDIRGHLGFQ